MNSEVLNLKFFFSVSSLSGVCNSAWVDSVANVGFFRAKQWKKDIIKCCHWASTTNIGLLYPNVIGGVIPIDVPPTKILEGMCPRHPRRRWRQCLSCKYVGTSPHEIWYINTASLKSIRRLTGNQWSCFRTGVMCSRLPGYLFLSTELDIFIGVQANFSTATGPS